MEIKISEFEVVKLASTGNHIYLRGILPKELNSDTVDIFFKDKLQEKKVFTDAELTLSGEFIQSITGNQFVDARVTHVRLLIELPLESLTIKDRLNATGLIHEFRDVFRKDKIRAMEILKVLGVSDQFAEEILLRNSYILPFI